MEFIAACFISSLCSCPLATRTTTGCFGTILAISYEEIKLKRNTVLRIYHPYKKSWTQINYSQIQDRKSQFKNRNRKIYYFQNSWKRLRLRHTQLSWGWNALYISLQVIWWPKKFPFWENQWKKETIHEFWLSWESIISFK